MSKFTKVVAMVTLVLWGLAAMHCTLEGVPGFDFLKTCCFLDTAPSAPQACDSDACAVEDGGYRSEVRSVTVPQPLLILALLSPAVQSPLTELRFATVVPSESPPDLPRFWQFAQRTALPSRAPSMAS